MIIRAGGGGGGSSASRMQNARCEKKRVALCVCLYIVTRQMAVGWETLAGEETPFLMTKHINLSSEPRFFIYQHTYHQPKQLTLYTYLTHTMGDFFRFQDTAAAERLECTH